MTATHAVRSMPADLRFDRRLRLLRVGLQALGWPSWQPQFSGRHDDPRRFERQSLEPRCAALARWLPAEPRDELLVAIADGGFTTRGDRSRSAARPGR